MWKLFTFNYNILDTDDQEISRWVNFPWDAKPKLTEKLMVDFLLENHGQVNNEEDLEGIQYLVERARSKVPMLEDSLEGKITICVIFGVTLKLPALIYSTMRSITPILNFWKSLEVSGLKGGVTRQFIQLGWE